MQALTRPRFLLQLQQLLVLLLLLQSAAAQTALGPKKTIYDDLLDHLFDNASFPYKASAMPICTTGQMMNVGQDMVLLQLYDLDEPTQMLTVDVWVESTWKDCRLSWDPSKFNGVDSFAIKSEEIWYPDLIFYESLHGNFEEGMFIYGESTARVYSDGSVQLGNQVVFKVFCRVNIAQFPYDTQKCNITFSSWTKDASNFRLSKKAEEAEDNDHAFTSASNGEWLVEGFPSFNKVSKRKLGMDETGGKAKDYTEVVFQLKLRRKYLFYQTYMLFPCMLLTWLTLFVFLLPAESGEKIGYVTTILLSLVVFLLLVAENIPRSGDHMPIMGIYFCITVALVSFANICTVISYSLSLRSENFCLPRWLRWVLQHGWLVGVRTSHHQQQAKLLSFSINRSRHADASPIEVAGQGGGDEDREAIELVSGSTKAKSESAGGSDGQNVNDWRFLGIIVDRVFFILYFLLNLAASVWILSRAA